LHSGTALIGNKGSAQRLDYGLVGDLINAAARVESLTKHYGALFLITREAFARLSVAPTVRLIDKAIVKGKSVPLELLEVKHSHSPDHFDETLERYNAAFAEYERGNFDKAERMFAALRDEKQDKPSALMSERCRDLIADPPQDWNGVYQLKDK
jgi:adenylate cyclase